MGYLLKKLNQVRLIAQPLLYHISPDPNLTVLEPRLPNYLLGDEAKEAEFEDLKTKRVCFATTIDGCLLGIQINEKKVFKDLPYVDWWLYLPEVDSKTKTVSNKELIDRQLVFDAHITGEWWITNPIKVKRYAKIRIYAYGKGCKEIPFKPYDGKKKLDPKWLNPKGEIITYLPQWEILQYD